MKKPDPSRQLNAEVIKKWVEGMSAEDHALWPDAGCLLLHLQPPAPRARVRRGEDGLDLQPDPGHPALPEGQAFKGGRDGRSKR